MNQSHQSYLKSAQNQQVDELKEWLSIPSISTIPAHKADMLDAANWLIENMKSSGLENIELIETDGHPLVYADWLHAGADKPTVLVYGHYDVQPVDPLELWDSAPFEPTVRGDDLFARGASDDKGQTFIHVKAVEAFIKTDGALPVNIKFLVEGEEESGGAAIAKYVPANKEKLAADVCVISDTGIMSPTQPVITYALRGMWAGEIRVTGPTTDLHSGMFGGVIHNANQALAELLAALHDGDGRVTVPGFYDNVTEMAADERAVLAKVPFGEQELLALSGAPAQYGEPEYTVVERIGARPTLEINGMWGGYISEGFKTVIPSQAHAKVSCRLVPDQNPDRIGKLIDDYLQSIAPETITVKVERLGDGAPAFLAPMDLPAIQASARAYEKVFGVEPVFKREGGGIPIVGDIQRELGMPVVLMGFGLPDDNLHAPNEKFHLPNFWRGIETAMVFMEEMGGE